MSSHDDNHSTEVKEVSFITPLILALITIFVILALVSTCDRKGHGCETKSTHGHEATHEQHDAEHATATEAHHTEEAHH